MWQLIDFIHRFGLIELFLIFFVLINLLTFLLYFIDKRRAIKNKHRISERTLLLFTIFLGGIGAVVGMYLLKHKTRKIKFKITACLGLIITASVLVVLLA